MRCASNFFYTPALIDRVNTRSVDGSTDGFPCVHVHTFNRSRLVLRIACELSPLTRVFFLYLYCGKWGALLVSRRYDMSIAWVHVTKRDMAETVCCNSCLYPFMKHVDPSVPRPWVKESLIIVRCFGLAWRTSTSTVCPCLHRYPILTVQKRYNKTTGRNRKRT